MQQTQDWARQHLRHGMLSELGMAELARVVGQCHTHIYQQGIEDEAARLALFNERLAPWRSVPLWVVRWVVDGRDCQRVYLTEGEWLCAGRTRP